MEYFNFLPEEIIYDILIRLPTESLLECRCVCKTWRNITQKPSFSKTHFRHHHLNHVSAARSGKLGFLALTQNMKNVNSSRNFQYFEYDENHDELTAPIQKITRMYFSPNPFWHAKFLASCNGLVCLSPNSACFQQWLDTPFCICNPITKEYVLLPLLKNDCGGIKGDDKTIGFGYVSSTNQYKLVVLMLETKFVQVHIYTLGSSSGWRNLGRFNLGRSEECWTLRATYLNGLLYWFDFEYDVMVTFDLAKEKFGVQFSIPPSPPRYAGYFWIGVLDGFFSYANSQEVEESLRYDVYLLKKKNDNHALVWRKEFTVVDVQPLAVMKRGRVLTYSDNYLSIHDAKASTSKRLVDSEEDFVDVFPHKNTLVSLKDIGEKDAKIMESADVEEQEAVIDRWCSSLIE